MVCKTVKSRIKRYPNGWRSTRCCRTLIDTQEVWWANPVCTQTDISTRIKLGLADVEAAGRRLQRFAPYIAKAFPETQAAGGIIESALLPVSQMQRKLEEYYDRPIPGIMYAKYDSHLPIAGSIKARAVSMKY